MTKEDFNFLSDVLFVLTDDFSMEDVLFIADVINVNYQVKYDNFPDNWMEEFQKKVNALYYN